VLRASRRPGAAVSAYTASTAAPAAHTPRIHPAGVEHQKPLPGVERLLGGTRLGLYQLLLAQRQA